MYIRNLLAETMRHSLGIIRDQETLERGIADVDYYQSIANHLRYDSSVSPYENYSLEGILAVAGASLACAMERRESRGAHYRSDYPQMEEKGRYASIVSREGDLYKVRLDTAGEYEN
jgi:aspartate oxidase